MKSKIKYIIMYGSGCFHDLYSCATSKKEAIEHIKDCMEENDCKLDMVTCLAVVESNIEQKVILKIK